MRSLVIFLLIFFTNVSHAIKLPGTAPSTSSDSELNELSLGIERSLYSEIFLFTGYTEFAHPNLNDTAYGSQSGIGVTLGAKTNIGLFGAITADLRYMGQASSVDTNHLNFSSTRFMPFAPTIGYKADSYIIKLDYQFTGNLELSKSLSDGSNLKFSKPTGFRLTFIFDKWFKTLPVGLYFETVKFTEEQDSSKGVSPLSKSFNTWQFGGVINVLL